MRVGVPVSGSRVSPVFDVACRLLLVDFQNGQEAHRTDHELLERDFAARARRVAGLGADVLICGAISRPLEAMVLSTGIELIPQTCGPVEEVLEAFSQGRLSECDYVIPGCRGRRRRCRHRGCGPRAGEPRGRGNRKMKNGQED